MKYIFPAVFTTDKYDSQYINVIFPDLQGCVTFGVGMEDAIYMAKDALKTMLDCDASSCHISPSNPFDVQRAYPDGLVMLICVDIDQVTTC